MPRNVRNFWIELAVDGKRTHIATGPVSKTGGFTLAVKQRHDGGIVKAVEMCGRVTTDGRIVLETLIPSAGFLPTITETKR